MLLHFQILSIISVNSFTFLLSLSISDKGFLIKSIIIFSISLSWGYIVLNAEPNIRANIVLCSAFFNAISTPNIIPIATSTCWGIPLPLILTESLTNWSKAEIFIFSLSLFNILYMYLILIMGINKW